MSALSDTTVYDRHFTATNRYLQDKEPVDQYFVDYPLIDLHRRKGLVVKSSGGTQIDVNLSYGAGTAEAFSGLDPLGKNQTDVVTKARYNRRYYAAPIVIAQTDEWENMGKEQVFDETKSLNDNAMMTLVSSIDLDMHGAQSGKKILGLQDHHTTDGTGTVGGHDSSTKTWWAPQYDTASTTFLTQTTTNVFNGISKWNEVMQDCQMQGGRINAMVTDPAVVNAYRIALSSMGYAETKLSDAKGIGGAWAPPFYQAEVLPSLNQSSGRTDFINTKELVLNVLSSANFNRTKFTSMQSNGQLGVIAYVVAGVQYVNRNRRRGGSHTNMTGV